jgi:hypothetical protein
MSRRSSTHRSLAHAVAERTIEDLAGDQADQLAAVAVANG